MVRIAALLFALPLALAAPTVEERGGSGDITYFYPGLGACGGWNGENDLIVAASHFVYEAGENPCGRRMRVWGERGSVDVTVVDKCMGCSYGSVDLSPAAFRIAVGDLGLGRRPGRWEWI